VIAVFLQRQPAWVRLLLSLPPSAYFLYIGLTAQHVVMKVLGIALGLSVPIVLLVAVWRERRRQSISRGR
jgi:hypothetical protein